MDLILLSSSTIRIFDIFYRLSAKNNKPVSVHLLTGLNKKAS